MGEEKVIKKTKKKRKNQEECFDIVTHYIYNTD